MGSPFRVAVRGKKTGVLTRRREYIQDVSAGQSQIAADRARTAGERAQRARLRTSDLRSRIEALAAGVKVSALTCDSAVDAYHQAVLEAELARKSAKVAFSRAADAHRAAGAAAQALGDVDGARRHHGLAVADDLRA